MSLFSSSFFVSSTSFWSSDKLDWFDSGSTSISGSWSLSSSCRIVWIFFNFLCQFSKVKVWSETFKIEPILYLWIASCNLALSIECGSIRTPDLFLIKIASNVYYYLKNLKKKIKKNYNLFKVDKIKKDLKDLGASKIDYLENYNIKSFKKI